MPSLNSVSCKLLLLVKPPPLTKNHFAKKTLGTLSEKNGIMWEKFPSGGPPPPLLSKKKLGLFFTLGPQEHPVLESYHSAILNGGQFLI